MAIYVDMRFLLAQMVYSGARREVLETRFYNNLVDEGDAPDSVGHRINLLLHPDPLPSSDAPDDGQIPSPSLPKSAPLLLKTEQHSVVSQIIQADLSEAHQLLFRQGSAGTGKTFAVKALIKTLQSHGEKCLICGTTAIAALQYPGKTTLGSFSRLGIDQQFAGSLRSNIGRGASGWADPCGRFNYYRY
jgi:hypothetical protein